MKKVKPVADFIRFPAPEKVTFCRNVSSKMAAEIVFLNPVIPLDEVNAAIDAFEAAILATKDGSHTAIAMMHEQESVLNTIFYALLGFVDRIANGDTVILLSSGFHLSKEPVRHPKSELAVLDSKHSGSVIIVCKPEIDTDAYIIQISEALSPEVLNAAADTTEVWETVKVSSHCRYEHQGLKSGTYYRFRIALVSKLGTTDFCAPVTKLIY